MKLTNKVSAAYNNHTAKNMIPQLRRVTSLFTGMKLDSDS